jgi:hypothetical protein
MAVRTAGRRWRVAVREGEGDGGWLLVGGW